jgi:penicillin-binding protein 1B
MDRFIWDVPSRVYGEPLVLVPDVNVDRIGLYGALRALGYWQVEDVPSKPGQYARGSRSIVLYLREREFAEGPEPAQRVRIRLHGDVIRQIHALTPDGKDAEPLPAVRLDAPVIARIYSDEREEREIVPLDEVPKHLVDAIIAVEDKRFFGHFGVSPRGIARALWTNLRAGHTLEGGSTITQQLVKNLFLSHKRTLTRKINEALMAMMVEIRYSKKTILNAYLNEMYLGQSGPISIAGVGAASRFYFGKDARSLDLAESALLAGMIRSPWRYSYLRDPNNALARRAFVLHRLVEEGKITPSDAAQAAVKPIPKKAYPLPARSSPYLVDAVRDEIRLPDDDLAKRGYRIFTAVDAQLQRAAERAVARQAKRLTRNGKHPEFAFVALNPHTGVVTALVGGADYASAQLNHVYRAVRQTGSAFKPIVYATAFEQAVTRDASRFTPTTMLRDSPLTMTVGGKTWTPRNAHASFLGDVTMRVALEDSLNIPAIRLSESVGLPNVLAMAKSLGITRELAAVPSLAIGSGEALPIELATAYTAFAGYGVRTTPYIVRRVVDAKGREVYRHGANFARSLSPQAAYLLTHILEGVLDRGTGASSRSWGFRRGAAGKTGTTNDGRDAWFVGYTPDTLAVVWVGYDDNRPLNMTGARVALPVWAEAMRDGLKNRLTRSFPVPEGIVFRRVDRSNGLLANDACPYAVEEAFLDGTEPHDYCSHHEVLPEVTEGAEGEVQLTEEASLLSTPSAEFLTESPIVDLSSAESSMRDTLVSDEIEASEVVADTIYAKIIEANVLDARNILPYQDPPLTLELGSGTLRQKGVSARRIIARRVYASYISANTVYAERVERGKRDE